MSSILRLFLIYDKGLAKLCSPNKDHANFMSLRCDDTVTKHWLKPHAGGERSEKSGGEQSASSSAASFRVERPINPKSTLRRYMFINSRRGESKSVAGDYLTTNQSRSCK